MFCNLKFRVSLAPTRSHLTLQALDVGGLYLSIGQNSYRYDFQSGFVVQLAPEYSHDPVEQIAYSLNNFKFSSKLDSLKVSQDDLTAFQIYYQVYLGTEGGRPISKSPSNFPVAIDLHELNTLIQNNGNESTILVDIEVNSYLSAKVTAFTVESNQNQFRFS